MIGPRLSIDVHGSRLYVGVFDAVLCAVVFAGVLGERLRPSERRAFTIATGIALAAVFFLVAVLVERARLRIGPAGRPSGGTAVGLTGAATTTVAEAGSPLVSAQAGLAGMAIDLTVGLIAAVAFLLFHDHENRGHDVIVAAAIGIGGSAVMRFMTAPSLNGGRLMRWFLELTLDDDDSAIRGTGWLGFAVAAMLFTTGVSMLASKGEAAFWGIALAAAAIDIAVLTPLTVKRTTWLQSACDRKLKDLAGSQHPVVSEAGPVSEMISVYSVEGPRAIAVAKDKDGHPVGIVQFHHLRGTVRNRDGTTTIGQVMMPLSALPHLSPETTLLDAATLLETDRRPAVVFEEAPGRLQVITADDLGCPRW